MFMWKWKAHQNSCIINLVPEYESNTLRKNHLKKKKHGKEKQKIGYMVCCNNRCGSHIFHKFLSWPLFKLCIFLFYQTALWSWLLWCNLPFVFPCLLLFMLLCHFQKFWINCQWKIASDSEMPFTALCSLWAVPLWIFDIHSGFYAVPDNLKNVWKVLLAIIGHIKIIPLCLICLVLLLVKVML